MGPLTLRRGLELSRNPPTIRIAQAIGINKVAEIAQRFGINKNPPKYYSIVLGAMETTLLQMTNAYAVIANGGRKVTPSLIDKIQDRHGKLVYSNDQRPCVDCKEDGKIPYIENNQPYITDPRSAYQLTSILEGVVQHTKTSLPVRQLNHTLAGKTGTTNDSKDTWYIGFSSDLVVGVFVGFDEPKTLGKNSSGASVAQPIYAEFMKGALANAPDRAFKMPAGLKLVKIDYLTGEPTTSPYGSFYEVFKQANYRDKIELTNVEIEEASDAVHVEEPDKNPVDINEIQDEGIY